MYNEQTKSLKFQTVLKMWETSNVWTFYNPSLQLSFLNWIRLQHYYAINENDYIDIKSYIVTNIVLSYLEAVFSLRRRKKNREGATSATSAASPTVHSRHDF